MLGRVVSCCALRFSIVTTTTLGFGDMYAQPGSLLGHIALAIQVAVRHILLGPLITRLAFLFTAGGPAASFPDAEKRRKGQATFLDEKVVA